MMMDVESKLTLIRSENHQISILKTIVNKHCCKWIFNQRQFQSNISSFCGFYCLYCLLICRGLDVNGIVSMFTNDTGFNDSIVHTFVCNKVF
jgi:hypothetical protein